MSVHTPSDETTIKTTVSDNLNVCVLNLLPKVAPRQV